MEESVFYSAGDDEYDCGVFEALGVDVSPTSCRRSSRSQETCGHVTRAVAAETGLPEGVPRRVRTPRRGSDRPGDRRPRARTGRPHPRHVGTEHRRPRRPLEQEEHSGRQGERWRQDGRRVDAPVPRRRIHPLQGTPLSGRLPGLVRPRVRSRLAGAGERRGREPLRHLRPRRVGRPAGASGLLFHPYLDGSTDGPRTAAGSTG